jgi:uncharacterized membrane protein YvbJ
MFCYNCGEKIDDKAVVCVHCGAETKNMKNTDKNIVINNSASASAVNPNNKTKKKYNLLLDLILICCTCGLWIIWMIIRPKYEY